MSERGIVVVLTAILAAVLFGALALAINHAHVSLIQQEVRAAADAAAHAATVSLCGTSACWDDAKAAALNTLHEYVVHGKPGDAARIDLNPHGGPVWEDGDSNWRIAVERGRWVPDRGFISLEIDPRGSNRAVPLRMAANAVRVSVRRSAVSYLAAPAWLAGEGYATESRATAVKGSPEAGCVAPFAVPACALVRNGELASGGLAVADRLFTSTARYCDRGAVGTAACEQIVPESFYTPTGDVDSGVTVASPTCSWNNPRFEEASDHFGVVGLPESAGSVSEARVREVIENTTRPCVPARLGEVFRVLRDGLTERETDDAMWRQISVSYDVRDPSHPPFSSVYGTSVATKTHDDRTCPAAPAPALGWGACNSRRYVYNGVLGRTYFPGERFEHGFRPAVTESSVRWPAAAHNTPLWRVQIPVIAPRGATTLNCPEGTTPGTERTWVSPDRVYEIIGFVTMNLFDTDIGAPPPLNPSRIHHERWGEGHSDRVWGFNRSRDTAPEGPTCYAPYGDATQPGCGGCNAVRGRVAEETDYLAMDQAGNPSVSIVYERATACYYENGLWWRQACHGDHFVGYFSENDCREGRCAGTLF